MWDHRFRRVLLKREGVAVALWGEPGIGKTHAATRMLAELPCRSVALHANLPLSSAVRRLPRAGTIAGWAERTLARLESGEVVPRERAVEAIGTALAAAAPIVVHLDDLHEADVERRGLIEALAGVVRRSRGVGLLVTSRSEPSEVFERVRLAPLPRIEIERLLEAEVAAPLPAAALEWIAGRAAGNPLFAIEYLRFLGRQGCLWSDGRRWHWRFPERDAIPPTVEVLIDLVVEESRRDERLARALAARAVLPGEVSAEVWAAVADLRTEELVLATRDLERRGIFGSGFPHPLYREVVLRSLPESERRQLARRAVELFRNDPLQAVMFLEDAAPEPRAALELLERAVQAARARNDGARAAQLLAQASDHAVGEERGRLALAAAAAFDSVDFARMLEFAVRAEAHLADASEALYLQAVALGTAGRHEDMTKVLSRLPESAKNGAAWLERYSSLLHRTARHHDLIAFWEAHGEQERHDAATAYRVGWAYLHTGDPEAAAAFVERWRDRPRLDLAARLSLGELEAAVAFYRGRYGDAERIYGEVLGWMRETGRPADLDAANLLRNQSMVRLQLGRYRESLLDLDRSLRIYSDAGHGLYYAQTLIMMSYAHLALGEHDRAEDELLEALEIFRRADPNSALVGNLAQLSRLYLQRSGGTNPLLARKFALEAVATATALGPGFHDLVAASALAHAHTATGQPELGRSLAEHVMSEGRRLGFAEVELSGRTARAEALEALGRVGEAREELQACHDQARALGLVFETAKLGLELDRLDGDAGRAGSRLAWFEERGLAAGVALVARYFPELARRVPTAEAIGTRANANRTGGTTRPSAGEPAATSARGTSERPTDRPVPLLEVLGPMRMRDGAGSWPVRGRKARTLLALLLEARMAGRSELARLELVDALYPGGDEVRASNSLKQLVSSLRTQLGEAAVRTAGTGYELGEVTSDAELFLATGNTALWRGLYLEGAEEAAREAVAEILYRELAAAASALLATDGAEAARVARFLLEADPYDLDHLRLGLVALRSAHNHRTLNRVYEQAKARFAEVGEVLPETWSDFVAQPPKV